MQSNRLAHNPLGVSQCLYVKMDPKCNPLELDFSTLAVHGGHSPDDWPHKPISEPFVASSTFKQEAPGEFEVCFSDFVPDVNQPDHYSLEIQL